MRRKSKVALCVSMLCVLGIGLAQAANAINPLKRSTDGNGPSRTSLLDTFHRELEHYRLRKESNQQQEQFGGKRRKAPLSAIPMAQQILQTQVVKSEGTLLLSDSPEYVTTQTGILYEDEVEGPVRVYFYHVNESAEKRKMAVILQNKSFRTNHIVVQRQLVAWPHPDYFNVGRRLSRMDLEPPVHKPVIYDLKPYETIALLPRLDKITVYPDRLISGMVDYTSSEPAQVSVMMLPADANPLSVYRGAPMVPYDSYHMRGTFLGADRYIEAIPPFHVNKGVAIMKIAYSEDNNYLHGYDASMNRDGTIQRFDQSHEASTTVESRHASYNHASNRGNYGIRDIVTIHTVGQGTYDLYFNPLGGPFAGTIGVAYKDGVEALWDVPELGYDAMGKGRIDDTRYIGTYEAGKDLVIRFMSPGASNLPVQFIFIPENNNP